MYLLKELDAKKEKVSGLAEGKLKACRKGSEDFGPVGNQKATNGC